MRKKTLCRMLEKKTKFESTFAFGEKSPTGADV